MIENQFIEKYSKGTRKFLFYNIRLDCITMNSTAVLTEIKSNRSKSMHKNALRKQ